MSEPSKTPEIEKLVNSKQAAEILGVSRSYVGAVKNAMRKAGCPVGIKFHVSIMRQWLIDNPDFSSERNRRDPFKTALREALECLQSPRHGQRKDVIERLKRILQTNREKNHCNICHKK